MKLIAYNADGSRISKYWRIRIDEPMGRVVCKIDGLISGTEQVELANLFAAAPELLAALKTLYGHFPCDRSHPELVKGCAGCIARAAIAKAEPHA